MTSRPPATTAPYNVSLRSTCADVDVTWVPTHASTHGRARRAHESSHRRRHDRHNRYNEGSQMTATVINDHFILRMSGSEASIYGAQVLELLGRARTNLSAKYGLELKSPTIVEVFTDQKDFGVRTFGMPGGHVACSLLLQESKRVQVALHASLTPAARCCRPYVARLPTHERNAEQEFESLKINPTALEG